MNHTERVLRWVLYALGALFTVIGFGYSLRMPWAVDAHLWKDGPMTISWHGSMLLSFGPQLFWIGVTREWGILPGFAAGGIVTQVGAGAQVLAVASRAGSTRLAVIGTVLVALGLGSLGLWIWSRRFSVRDVRRTPKVMRVVSAVCFVPLLVASLGLLTRHPHVFPWPLNPDSSTVMGWMFLGTAVCFLFAVFQPHWSYMRTLLMGFLVYDAVLIPYYVGHYERVKPEHELSLGIFMVVLTSSALFAIWFLFLDRRTRGLGIVETTSVAR